MTKIQIAFDPLSEELELTSDGKAFGSEKNKLYTIAKEIGYPACLRPVRKRYLLWNGLLPELINEVNDDELDVVFEGTEKDFQELNDAFVQSEDQVLELGYEAKWKLQLKRSFDASAVCERLRSIVGELREWCDTRAELSFLDKLLQRVDLDTVENCVAELQMFLKGIMEKWDSSGNIFKEEKLQYLRLFQQDLFEAEKRLSDERRRKH